MNGDRDANPLYTAARARLFFGFLGIFGFLGFLGCSHFGLGFWVFWVSQKPVVYPG